MLSPIPNIKNTLDMKVKAAEAKIKTIEVCITSVSGRFRRGSEVSVQPLLESKLFHFHGEF